MNFLPAKRKRPKMMAPKEDAPIVCPGHCKHVRQTYECAALGRVMISPLGKVMEHHQCYGRMEGHHETTRGAGGGDDRVIPLCSLAHKNHHDGCKFVGLDQDAMATALWRASPHRIKYERALCRPDPHTKGN